MLKGVIFDLDGTLTFTEELHYKAFAAIFKEYGIDFTYEEEVTKYAGSGSENIFTKVFADRGKAVSAEEIKQLCAKKKELYKKIVQESEIPVVVGARELVEKIHELGVKKIIATGNSDMQAVHLVLEKAKLFKYFPEILSIKEVPRGKPFPDVFLEAAKRIGCEPWECVVFEDSINGVEAAYAAGITCVALETSTHREDLLKAGAESVIRNYLEIIHNPLFYAKVPN